MVHKDSFSRSRVQLHTQPIIKCQAVKPLSVCQCIESMYMMQASKGKTRGYSSNWQNDVEVSVNSATIVYQADVMHSDTANVCKVITLTPEPEKPI